MNKRIKRLLALDANLIQTMAIKDAAPAMLALLREMDGALSLAHKALLSATTLYEAAGLQYVRDGAIIEAIHCSVEVADLKEVLHRLAALGYGNKEGE